MIERIICYIHIVGILLWYIQMVLSTLHDQAPNFPHVINHNAEDST